MTENIKSDTKLPISENETRPKTPDDKARPLWAGAGSQRPPVKDVGPPPDGGYYAWSQALLGHLAIFNTWGIINSFGIFQTYYKSTLDRSLSEISWIGAIQVSLLFFVGTFSGRANDAGYFRTVFITGSILQALSVFLTSLCKKYWHFILAQGFLSGIGNGFVFCPSFALLSGYFSKNRALAIGVAASGSATGGVIFPAIAEHLLADIGFPWTMRVIGFVMLATMCLTIPFFKTRLPPRKIGPLVEWPAFKETPYLLFSISIFLTFWGLYFAFYYIGIFSRDKLGASQTTSINILAIMNGLGFFGRLIPGFLADRYLGPLNTFIPFVFSSAVLIYCWAAVNSFGAIYVFSVFYGFFAAGVQSLFLASLSSLTTDLTKMGVRMGMVLSIMSVATLTGEPLAGRLIQVDGGRYLYAQMFAGSSMMLGLVMLVMARGAKAGFGLRKKV
ncbi:MAG: hypothetical protein Q9227_005177 [Pyrenula ochraceoflavens]